MTILTIQARLPREVEGVTEVRVDTGFGATPSFPGREGDDLRSPEALG